MSRRVFVVDDSAFVRRALTRILDRATGYHVVGEAADAVEALRAHVSDAEAHDAIAVVALLNFANRVALATGITAADDL